MKPTLQVIESGQRRDSVATARKRTAPLTDYSFHTGSADDFSGRCKGEGLPSFRGISDDYFKKEARAHFASEAAFFALIVVTAAIPVIEGIRGLARFVYGVL